MLGWLCAQHRFFPYLRNREALRDFLYGFGKQLKADLMAFEAPMLFEKAETLW